MKILELVIAAVLVNAASAHAADPFAGRWVLDPARSKYATGTGPKRMVVEMAAVGAGVHYFSETILANGSTARSEYTADYDGKPATVVGAHGLLLPVSLKRIAPNAVVASYTRGGRVVATSHRVVSNDGTVMTITTTSRDPSGRTVTNVGVYVRYP
jgi:hypothetical protein